MGSIEKACDTTKNLTTFTAKGEVTFADFRDATISFYDGETTSLILWDLTKADVSGITNDQIVGLVHQMKQAFTQRKNAKTAFVADASLGYGLGRMFSSYAEMEDMPVEFYIFQSIHDAREWLGV